MMATETTGWAVDQILNAAMGFQMSTARWEGFCAGNTHWPVRNVVVCYAPTLEVLRRAASEGKTLIVVRVHPFYMHGGLNYPYNTEGLEAALKDDPIVAAKNDIITVNKIVIYRMSTAWELKARAPRIVGDPEATVTRLAVLAGETDPKLGLAALIADPNVDGVIAGAGGVIDEVDGAIGYFRDVVGSGRKIAMLAVGYGPSEEPGGVELARWMRTVLPDLSIDWWPVPDPCWIPR
jgi:hypothetical protein